ncbi:hypothetical protein BKA70DRAFT_1110677, partial [Coprinopsis sp. MPI-PUGE-AT-0042]
LVPFASRPSSLFFLLSADNFEEAWRTWLFHSLENKGFSAVGWQGDALQTMFRDLKHSIFTSQEKHELANIVRDPLLLWIFQRTIEISTSVKKADKAMRPHGRNVSLPCLKCKDLPVKEQCVQDVRLKVSADSHEHLIGCGVSFHPKNKVVRATPTAKTMTPPKKVYHPDELGLRKIGPKESTISRCGRQIYRIFDQDTGEQRDTWVYGAFSEDSLHKLRTHNARYSQLKGIQRGAQFQGYSTGKMVPRGERAPKGGAPGDCFGFYADMQATDVEHIDVLFDHAEDSGIIMRAAKIFCPSVYASLSEAGSVGERLGASASTLFYCGNYTAPLHRDNDECPGLCTQFDLTADTSHYEYSFVNMAYSCYFVARENSFWTFRGSDVHGSMLPSMEPLQVHLGAPTPPPDRVSNGDHQTKTRRNAMSAKRYEDVRLNRSAINHYWAS